MKFAGLVKLLLVALLGCLSLQIASADEGRAHLKLLQELSVHMLSRRCHFSSSIIPPRARVLIRRQRTKERLYQAPDATATSLTMLVRDGVDMYFSSSPPQARTCECVPSSAAAARR
jgi:hypothetical protein